MHVSPGASDAAETLAAGQSFPQEKSSNKRPTLLVVDDEEGPRQSLRVIFKEDFDVLMANDGASAIALAKSNQIDVAVVDIRMAGTSGIEVLERLKFVDPSIEVVMMTAFETSETMKQALRLRACDYINKPFDITTIRDAVQTALQRHSLVNELETNASKLQQLQDELGKRKLDEQLARDRGEIYAGIIHDINGPLTIISGLLQNINQRIGSETELRGEELALVKDRLTRITRQVTNCIEISRRYLGTSETGPAPVPRIWINQVLADVSELVRSHPSAVNHQFEVHPLRQDTTVAINGTDLIQILLNLVLNAMQASQASHRVEIKSSIIDANLPEKGAGANDLFIAQNPGLTDAPYVALTVEDDGPGIEPPVLKRIFEPFFTTQARRHGSGLGLCIVERLVKQARGAIRVRTEPGQGAKFTVYLSCIPPAG